MGVKRVQKGSPGHAVGAATLEPGRVHGAGIATDYVVSNAAWIIRIPYPELSVIENVESFGSELNAARFPDLEMPQQRDVEVQAARIIEKISPRIPERQPAGSNKL